MYFHSRYLNLGGRLRNKSSIAIWMKMATSNSKFRLSLNANFWFGQYRGQLQAKIIFYHKNYIFPSQNSNLMCTLCSIWKQELPIWTVTYLMPGSRFHGQSREYKSFTYEGVISFNFFSTLVTWNRDATRLILWLISR